MTCTNEIYESADFIDGQMSDETGNVTTGDK